MRRQSFGTCLVLALGSALLGGHPVVTAMTVVDKDSPHDFEKLEWTLELGGDSFIPAGEQRLVTLAIRNPTSETIYLFKTSSHTGQVCTPPPVTCTTTTVTDYAPVVSFEVVVRELGSGTQIQRATRQIAETVWFPQYATIGPTGQQTLAIPLRLAPSPIFSYLVDTAGMPENEYEVLVSANHQNSFTPNFDTFIGSLRIQVGEVGVTSLPPETPWQTNAYGTQTVNLAWNYNMGYQFVPQVSGKVTKLGGFFNGTKTVRLYNSSGSVLALADVTAANSWGYADISPVQVTAGQTYTVAVNLAGSGGSYRNLGTAPLPKTFGKIQILKSVYRASSDLVPTSSSTGMYGQADIEFVPDQ